MLKGFGLVKLSCVWELCFERVFWNAFELFLNALAIFMVRSGFNILLLFLRDFFVVVLVDFKLIFWGFK